MKPLLVLPKHINHKCVIDYDGVLFECYPHSVEPDGKAMELTVKFKVLGPFQEDEVYGTWIGYDNCMRGRLEESA